MYKHRIVHIGAFRGYARIADCASGETRHDANLLAFPRTENSPRARSRSRGSEQSSDTRSPVEKEFQHRAIAK